MKTCTKCLEYKDFSSFDRQSKHSSGFRQVCKLCRAASYSANAEDNRRKSKLHRQTEAYRAAQRERHSRWAAANEERLAAYQETYRNDPDNKKRKASLELAQSARRNERARRRYLRRKQTEPDTLRAEIAANSIARRVFQKQARPSWANESKIGEFYATADGLRMLVGEWYQVDHIVPLRSKHVCGLHCEANLQVLDRKTNAIKGNRYWPDMW